MAVKNGQSLFSYRQRLFTGCQILREANMQVYTKVCPKLSVPGVGWMAWKMLFILSIKGILSVPITHQVKQSNQWHAW